MKYVRELIKDIQKQIPFKSSIMFLTNQEDLILQIIFEKDNIPHCTMFTLEEPLLISCENKLLIYKILKDLFILYNNIKYHNNSSEMFLSEVIQ